MSFISAPVLAGVLISTTGVTLMDLPAADPWRSSASQVAKLLDEKGLVALVGAADGSLAHVAAQVATRRRVPVVVLSGEESLMHAGDPWVFRAVPDDYEQAKALLAGAQAKGKKAEIVVPEGREGRERRRSLEKACRQAGVAVSDAESDLVLLWLDPQEALRWFSGKDLNGKRILSSLRLDDEAFLVSAPPAAEGMAMPMLSLRQAADEAVTAISLAARERGAAPAGVRQGLAEAKRLGAFTVGRLRQGRLQR